MLALDRHVTVLAILGRAVLFGMIAQQCVGLPPVDAVDALDVGVGDDVVDFITPLPYLVFLALDERRRHVAVVLVAIDE